MHFFLLLLFTAVFLSFFPKIRDGLLWLAALVALVYVYALAFPESAIAEFLHQLLLHYVLTVEATKRLTPRVQRNR